MTMTFVDGFVAAVPTANRQKFIDHARYCAQIFKDHGALRVVETWGDDVPEGEVTSFTMAVKREEDESVVFSWVTWASKEARDAGWAKIMADERMQGEMPFDGKRLIHGGFQVIVEG